MTRSTANGWTPIRSASTLSPDSRAAIRPSTLAAICGVDAGAIREAAGIIGEAEALLTFVLQGVYQSHQATAAACQANNINLLRGMIGRPGLRAPADEWPADCPEHSRDRLQRRSPRRFATGRTRRRLPTSRSSGTSSRSRSRIGGPDACDGDLALRRGGLDRFSLDHGTNPAVSLPELGRIRSILEQERALRRRLRRLPDRDRASSPTSCAGRDLGREDRDIHQRRPHRSPVRAGGRTARRGPSRHADLHRLRKTARPL